MVPPPAQRRDHQYARGVEHDRNHHPAQPHDRHLLDDERRHQHRRNAADGKAEADAKIDLGALDMFHDPAAATTPGLPPMAGPRQMRRSTWPIWICFTLAPTPISEAPVAITGKLERGSMPIRPNLTSIGA